MGCWCDGQLPWVWGFVLVGSLCQIAGFVLPWWFVIMDGQYIGLWFFINCKTGIEDFGNCTTYSFKDADTDSLFTGNNIVSLHEFSALQVLIAVGCGIILLAAFTLACLQISGSRLPEPYTFVTFLLFLSGFAVATSIGLFAWIHVDTAKEQPGYSLTGRSFPYCAVISGVGLVCALAAALCLMVMLCHWSNYQDDDSSSDDDIPSFRNYEKPRQMYDNSAYNQNELNYYDRSRKTGYYDKNDYNQPQAYTGHGYQYQNGGRSGYDYGASRGGGGGYQSRSGYRY